MRIRLQLLFDALRYSFTFTPIVLALLGLGLAFVTLQWDARAGNLGEGLQVSRSVWLYTGGVDSARSVLSTVAASVLSVAALAFSISITALALAAGQFGSRLLRNFLDDGAFKWTLGVFAATFLFCLVVLRSTRGENEGLFVPQISISIALLLTIVCVLLLCFFLNHVARSIQAPYVCADAAKDLHKEIDRLFAVSQRQQGRQSNAPGAPQAPDFSGAISVGGERDGYVKIINYEYLIDLARRENLVFGMAIRPGQFAFKGEPLLRVLGQNGRDLAKNQQRLKTNVRRAVVIGRSRSPLQDPEYGINQLVEVAVRALSPAINDPFTAATCLDHLGAALRHVLRLELPSPLLVDERGDLRVVAKNWSFEGMCDAAFNMIRQYGRDSASVSIHLLETLESVAHACQSDRERTIIEQHARMTRRECAENIEGPTDQNDIQERFSRVLTALGRN